MHKAFSIVSAQDIPAESLDSARNFIAAYALEKVTEQINKLSQELNKISANLYSPIVEPSLPLERYTNQQMADKAISIPDHLTRAQKTPN